MYDLLNIVCIRMANNSRSTTNSFLEKQIFTSSRSLYEQIYSKNKGEMNYKAEHALRNYMKRSIYRATPYRLLSSFKFLDIKASNSMLKNYISINNNFKVYTNIDSLWLKNYISSLKINNLGHLLFKCNENVINITEIYIYNEWNSSKKILKTSNNIIITEILNFTKSPKPYKEISNHLNHLFGSISKNVVECILIELLKTELLLTNLDQKIYHHNFQALDRFLKEKSLNYNKHTHDIIIKNINKINTTVDKLDINIIKEIEKCLKSIAESSSYLNFDTESNINHFNIDRNRIKKDFNSFVKFIQKYASRKDYDKRYRADVLFLLDRFGDGIVKFTDFYSDYTQVRQKHLYMANNYDDIFLYLKKEISILSEISKLQRSQSIDLSHLKLNNFDENKKYSPSFHLSVNIFSKDGKTLKYNLSDYICKNGIAKSEGRLSYINKNIYSNLRYIDESIFKMNNLKTISTNYFPKNPYFINIMKDFCESEYSFSMNSWAKNDEFDIENLYIKVIDGKIFLLEVKNSNIEIVSFNQYNVANALDLAPELVKDLLYWSDNYFADSYSLFYDLQSIRNNHIVFPEIKYENITLFPKSWILNLMIEDKLKKEPFIKELLVKIKIFNIPRYVYVRQFDRRIFIDLYNEYDLNFIWKLYNLKNRYNIYFEDISYDINESIVSNKQNDKYLTEVMFNFIKTEPSLSEQIYDEVKCHGISKTYTPIDSNWFQYNIILPKEFQNDFIAYTLENLISDINDFSPLKSYFFIPYFDNYHHIRIRLKFKEIIDLTQINNIFSKYAKRNTLIEYEIAFYKPDLHKYKNKMVLYFAEELFYIDSILTISICKMNSKNKRNIVLTLIFKILSTYSSSLSDQFRVASKYYNKKEYSSIFRYNEKQYIEILKNSYTLYDTDELISNSDLKKWNTYLSRLLNCQGFINLAENDKHSIIRNIIHLLCLRTFGTNSDEENICINIVCRVINREIRKNKS